MNDARPGQLGHSGSRQGRVLSNIAARGKRGLHRHVMQTVSFGAAVLCRLTHSYPVQKHHVLEHLKY